MIDFVRVQPENIQVKGRILDRISELIDSGHYIYGAAVRDFEHSFAKYMDSDYAIGVNSGTDALFLSLKALGIQPGDEVITVSLTFPATVMAILNAQAVPVLVDVDDSLTIDPDQIRNAITEKTRAIIPVHYTGKMARMDEICEIARENNLLIIEDAAQAVGAYYKDKSAGSWGHTGCFSFFPTKNLSTMGDAGIVTTQNLELDRKFRLLQNFGRTDRDHFDLCGYNSRMDAIHAIILQEKIPFIDKWNKARIEIAARYSEALSHKFHTPHTESYEKEVFHFYIIRTHMEENTVLIERAKSVGVDLRIHYDRPIHKQRFIKNYEVNVKSMKNTDAFCRTMITLPCYPDLQIDEQQKIIEVLKEIA